jgi:phosphate:Na+ symporter
MRVLINVIYINILSQPSAARAGLLRRPSASRSLLSCGPGRLRAGCPMELAQIAFNIAGGLALFLYGMVLMSGGLQRAAGERAKRILERMTDRPIKGVLTGALITGIIQSSSVTTVLLVGMVNAGLMSLRQAVGVVFGANIGTTVTAQIVALRIGLYALPIVALGLLISFAPGEPFRKYLGQALLGLGFIFLGMTFMGSGAKPLQSLSSFMGLVRLFGDEPLWGIASGAIFTAAIQSSSATVALVIAMAMEGAIDLRAAVPFVLGANIGTCATALIASIGTSKDAKRVAAIHLMFNLIGTAIVLPFLGHFIGLAALTARDLPRQIANAHTLFNVLTTACLLPFADRLISISRIAIPGEDYGVERVGYLDRKMFKVPSIALEQASREVGRMARITFEMFSHSREILFNGKGDLFKIVEKKEALLDEAHHALDRYLTELSEGAMSKEESAKLSGLLHTITDIERIGDHINNISEIGVAKIREGLAFSPLAMEELAHMFDEVERMYVEAMDAFLKGDKARAMEITRIGPRIDAMKEEYMENHLDRLRRNICSPKAGVLFVDILRNLERIADHSDNIAHATIFGF